MKKFFPNLDPPRDQFSSGGTGIILKDNFFSVNFVASCFQTTNLIAEEIRSDYLIIVISFKIENSLNIPL